MTCIKVLVRCPSILTLLLVSQCCHYIGVSQRSHRAKSELDLSNIAVTFLASEQIFWEAIMSSMFYMLDVTTGRKTCVNNSNYSCVVPTTSHTHTHTHTHTHSEFLETN